jgi:hypothetical protein
MTSTDVAGTTLSRNDGHERNGDWNDTDTWNEDWNDTDTWD